jgi:hypothetical protein
VPKFHEVEEFSEKRKEMDGEWHKNEESCPCGAAFFNKRGKTTIA